MSNGSRIEPQEGRNPEAIEHYKHYVQALKQREIEPIVTLFHFTLPRMVYELGGRKKKNIHYFTRFGRKIISELGVSVRYIITINEPEVYAHESYSGNWPPMRQSKKTMITVLNNCKQAHKQAAKGYPYAESAI